MGKQICFFVTQKDVDKMVEMIYLNNGIIVDFEGQELKNEELLSLADYDFCQKRFGYNKFLITNRQFALSYKSLNERKEISQIESEVIEFSLCVPHPKMIIDTSPVDDNFKKGGYIIIDDSDEYHRQMNDLMKNPKYINNPNYIQNGFEHGRFWYEPDYYDEKGLKISKSKKLDVLFISLSKFIKMNYKLTADKFAYIGPDAYEKCQEGVFVPSSGRNVIKVN